MKLKIRLVVEHGHENERIIIDVLEDTDLTYYMVCDSTKLKSGSYSNKLRHTYWFVSKDVKKGDVVVLYTMKGENQDVKNNDGSTSHFYHWNIDSNIWNDDGDLAILIYTPDWQTHLAK